MFPTTVAITGVLGFVASHLLPLLRERAARIIGIVRQGRDASSIERQGVEVRRADLDRPETLGDVFRGADAIVHLSGMAQVVGLRPALEAAGVRRGVFISSAGVHTRLESPGADKKRAGEAALRDSEIGYTILRPSMIYGTPADRNMVRLLRWVRRFPMVPVPGGGETLQQPIHVDDLVAVIIAALERPEAARREYDVGGPEPLRLDDLIRVAGQAMGRSVQILPLPLMPAHRVARAIERLGLRSPVRPEQILRLTESKAVDIGPVRRDLGFSPRGFEAGIRAEAAMLDGRRGQ